MSDNFKIPNGWSETTFGAIVATVSVNDKKLPKGEYLDAGLFPVVDQGQQFIGGYSNDETKVISQDLPVLVFGDHTRAFKYLDVPFVPGADGIKVLKPIGVDAKWLYQIAHALEFPDKGYARHYQHLKTAKIFVPPLPEQRRIVAEIEKQFSRLEEGVSALKRVQANLKRYRAAVLKAACEGRLVPTEAKWRQTTLGEVLVGIEAGRSFRCEERPPKADEVGVVKVSAVTWGTYNELESKTCLDKSRIEERFFVQPEDFLFSRANTIEFIGACVIAKKVTLRVMLSDKILRFSFSTKVNPSWVLYWLRSGFGHNEIERLSTGNQDSMRNIGQDRIRQISIKLPPLAEQKRIVEEVERRLSVVEELESLVTTNLQRAARLRQSVLQKAFEGKL